jgi:thioredoxin-like negative regulator of GroEL
MASVLSKVARETKGQAIVGLVPATDNVLARMFGVRRIPTVIVVRNAQITASFIGVIPKEAVEKLLNES